MHQLIAEVPSHHNLHTSTSWNLALSFLPVTRNGVDRMRRGRQKERDQTNVGSRSDYHEAIATLQCIVNRERDLIIW